MKCKHCGNVIELRYYDAYNVHLQERQECFQCNHFVEAREDHPTTTLIVDGEMYTVGAEDSKSSMRGFGGAEFFFKFLDSDTAYTSTNMWHRGSIPEALRPQMPDNAVWLNPNKDRSLVHFELLN